MQALTRSYISSLRVAKRLLLPSLLPSRTVSISQTPSTALRFGSTSPPFCRLPVHKKFLTFCNTMTSEPRIPDFKEYQDYGDPSFWDKTYAKQQEPLEWYQSYSDVAPLIRNYVPRPSRVLMTGCGNAEISEDMVKDGYEDIVNIDNSAIVIEAMQEKYQNVPQLKYMTMDVTDLSPFDNCSFDSVIDKGTLDAIMCVVGGPYNAGLMMAEISRVLNPGGVYMLITTGSPESRLPLLNTMAFGWQVTLYVIPQPDVEMDLEDRTRAYAEPVPLGPDGICTIPPMLEAADTLFVFVCTKPKA